MAEANNFATDWTFAFRCLQVFFGYRYLLAAVLAGGYLYLLVRRRKRSSFVIFTGTVILAVIIFTPILQPLLIRLSNTSTFYRLFWTVPFPFIGAYFIVSWIEKIPERIRWGRPAAFLLAAAVILATQPVYIQLRLNFRKPENYFKVPNQLIYACNEIHSDFEGKFGPIDPKDAKTSPGVFFPEGLDVYARQYDASLRLMIGRNKLLRYFGSQVVGEEDEARQEGWRYKILNVIYSGDEVSTEDFKEALRYTRTRYLVIPENYTCHEQLLAAGGEIVAEGNGLIIYYYPMQLPKILKERIERGEVPGDSRTQAMAAGSGEEIGTEAEDGEGENPEAESPEVVSPEADGAEADSSETVRAKADMEIEDPKTKSNDSMETGHTETGGGEGEAVPPGEETLDLGPARWTINHYHVTAAEADRTYQFAVLNDLHLIADSGEILPERREEAMERRDRLFLDSEGNRSADLWPLLAEKVDAMGLDGIIIAGDLLDFYSEANLSLVRDAFASMKTPLIYLRADHDVGNWNTGEEKKKIRASERALCDHSPVMTMEFPGFTIAGINNSTSQLNQKGAGLLEQILSDKSRPVILFTHVPFQPADDTGLSEASRAVWQDRALLWGSDSYYRPNETTGAFMEQLMSSDSPVKAVFAGHLHFRYDGILHDDVYQHVLDANYAGNIAILSVGPESEG